MGKVFRQKTERSICMTDNGRVLKKDDVPKIVDCFLDTDSSFDSSKQIVRITVSNGSRVLIRHYCVDDLQQRLTDYMSSKKKGDNGSDRSLLSVLERKHYSVLESVLGEELFPEGVPMLEEASEVTRFIYYGLLEGQNYAYYVDEPDFEAFAGFFGLIDEVEECLAKDIENFDLQGVLGLHEYDAAVYAFSDLLSRFSIEEEI